MAENGVYNIIFSSSSKVYNIPEYLPLDENHPVGQCTNPYGRTKHMIEQILQDVAMADEVGTVVSHILNVLAYTSTSIGYRGTKIFYVTASILTKNVCVKWGFNPS